MAGFASLRERMIERQVVARGIDNPALVSALRAVPRELFVSKGFESAAYADAPLPIESGQTISQPYIVALTIDAAQVGSNDKVLEIGAGSGYAAAVIGQIADQVIAIERHRELAQLAGDRMKRLGYSNVRIIEGDGTRGYPDEAPFDAIVAAASGSHVPQVLLDQLRPGGRLVMPIGEPGAIQELVKVTKHPNGSLKREELGAVRFVPLVGAHAFPEN
ncbi:protein-L-isoaspartate(D-aspartate) O-methyltransferase [Sphingomonas sp. HDW15A]|uniref:protein-L-isoaspartate(D-aspartate) O-methyltransferase n=1 Tax=Sphingomonas sp. HDW15A TaxID=2714942 RepID=UPI00140CDBE6|nr:protein-L-isoaspartate(D-aspartate) O-methyltransferase [Sphingomonas sp. HDW15A]QIK96443.1 protein-L-isoaspartate(D-aspartate) O-methyltransferase [Sphingomonas sp. HDW15A]